MCFPRTSPPRLFLLMWYDEAQMLGRFVLYTHARVGSSQAWMTGPRARRTRRAGCPRSWLLAEGLAAGRKPGRRRIKKKKIALGNPIGVAPKDEFRSCLAVPTVLPRLVT